MKKIIFYSIPLLILFSCNSEREEIISTYEGGAKKKTEIFTGDTKIEEMFYHENGNNEMGGPVNKKGQRNGTWTSWYKDGKIWSEGIFAEGQRQGKGVIYYTNGQKRCEGNYKDNKPVGSWMFWDDLGEVQKEVNY